MQFGTYCLLRIFWAFQISQKGRWLELFHWQRLFFNGAKNIYEVSSIAQWASYVVGVSLPKNSRNYLILLSPKLQRKISKICAQSKCESFMRASKDRARQAHLINGLFLCLKMSLAFMNLFICFRFALQFFLLTSQQKIFQYTKMSSH